MRLKPIWPGEAPNWSAIHETEFSARLLPIAQTRRQRAAKRMQTGPLEVGIDQNNTRTQSRYAAFWERRLGDPHERLTLTKQDAWVSHASR
jgi:hypothetical protein